MSSLGYSRNHLPQLRHSSIDNYAYEMVPAVKSEAKVNLLDIVEDKRLSPG